MIQREEAYSQEGPFWRLLQASVQDGIRDLETGYDRVAFTWLDPRTEGGCTADFILARGLAQAWRAPEGVEPISVTVLAGTVRGGSLQVCEVPLERWPLLGGIHVAADGPAVLTAGTAVTRRLRIDAGAPQLAELVGSEDLTDLLPGDMTLTIGLSEGTPILAKAMEAAGLEGRGVVLLWLYQANAGPVDIGDRGGPLRNGWHPLARAEAHVSDSYLTKPLLVLMGTEMEEHWYDQEFRNVLFKGLSAAAQERGLEVTHRAFLDALAEASPLRKVLPPHLTRHFPEAERLFWTLPDQVFPEIHPPDWDESSPLERLSLLSGLKQEEEGVIAGN